MAKDHAFLFLQPAAGDVLVEIAAEFEHLPAAQTDVVKSECTSGKVASKSSRSFRRA
jgi:hypothetical protein